MLSLRTTMRLVAWGMIGACGGKAATSDGPLPGDSGPAPSPSDTVDVDTSRGVDSTPVVDSTVDSGLGDEVVASVGAGNLPLLMVIDAELATPGPVAVVCRSVDDSDVLLFRSEDADTHHQVALPGLLPDTDYSCAVARVSAEGTAGPATVVAVRPPTLPGSLPTLTVPLDEGVEPAWVMANTTHGCGAQSTQWVFVADRAGRIRWAYEVGMGFDIDIDASWTGDRVHLGGGWALFDEDEPHRGLMRQLTLDGQVLVDRTTPHVGLGFNHHSEVLPDGTVVSLTTHPHDEDGPRWYGVAVEQWDPTTDSVPWSWTTADVADQLPRQDPVSPWHANALEWVTDPHGDALWVSTYVSQALWRIDRDSGAITHVLSSYGDFALIDTSGAPLPDGEWFFGQHDPDVMPDGRVLLYDNGVGRPGSNSQSRVVEYQLDLDARTATRTWSWTEAGWFTPFVGDADYLPDGHVLVTKGVIHCVTPWQTGQVSSVIELDLDAAGGAAPVWRMDWGDEDGQVFRSQRYDGCDIFSHAGSCPTVADEVAQLGL